jgi:predicted ribosome quality control (RQC) complex YloA/Tae2 family protein
VSNPIRFDPLLVRHLARELHERLSGRTAAFAPQYAEDGSVTLALDRGETLRLDLHRARGWVRILAADSPAGEPLGARIDGVSAVRDERRMMVRLLGGGRFRTSGRRLLVELHGTRWNALLLDESNSIVSVLRASQRGRILEPGRLYEAPEPRPRVLPGDDREGAWRRWMEHLQPADPADRSDVLKRHFAGTGTLNAPAILGEAAHGDHGLDDAFQRWLDLVLSREARPVILELPGGPHPYPFPLPGIPSNPAASLLAGMEAAAQHEPAAGTAGADQLQPIRRRVEAADRRIERLRERLDSGAAAAEERQRADLLLARLHEVPRGVEVVRLEGWDGEEVEISLDPGLSPQENAEALYRSARRRSRATERVPRLIEAAERERSRWREALEAAERGAVPEWVRASLASAPRDRRGGAASADDRVTVPYRTYRTSGGLEVRVGRSARDNDRLTFGFSSPGDVWLHAQSVAGSHVILRWRNPEGSPPARDLTEAAVLAALHSRARSSGLVAVDWTRRRHVRKPRGAPPGAVIPQQVKTLFVEPDPAIEERLRQEG